MLSFLYVMIMNNGQIRVLRWSLQHQKEHGKKMLMAGGTKTLMEAIQRTSGRRLTKNGIILMLMVICRQAGTRKVMFTIT